MDVFIYALTNCMNDPINGLYLGPINTVFFLQKDTLHVIGISEKIRGNLNIKKLGHNLNKACYPNDILTK